MFNYLKTLFTFIGEIIFWVMWPLLWLYLKGSTRTRVIVMSEDHIALVKSWVSPNKWSLPGGGIHRGESAIDGAIREVHEELGIMLHPKQLQELSQSNIQEFGFHYRAHTYIARLPTRQNFQTKLGEIRIAEWIALKSLKTEGVAPSVRQLVGEWQGTS